MIKKIVKLKKHLNIKIDLSKKNKQELYILYNNLKRNYSNDSLNCLETKKQYGVISKNNKDSSIVLFLEKKKSSIPEISSMNNKEICQYLDTHSGRKLYRKTCKHLKIKDSNWNYFYNHFIPMDIVTDIESKNIKCNISSNDKFKVSIFSDKNNKIERIKNIAFKRLQCLDNSGVSCYSGDIKLWLSEKEKQISKNRNDILTFKNINSGMCCNRQYINLWRAEELPKVLVHEYIHLTEFDFVKTREMDLFFYKIFNINPKSTINPFEAQTELLAIILNTNLVAIEKNIEFKKVIELLEIELTFSLMQCAKVLYHYSFNSWEEFIDKTNTNKLTQETNVFSYFIVKCILFYSLNDWMNYQQNNHTVNIHKKKIFWNMNNSNKSLHNWMQLVQVCSKNKSFIKIINSFIKSFDNKKCNNLYKTLRMTIIE